MRAVYHGSRLLVLFGLWAIRTVAAQDSVSTLAGQALVTGISNGFRTNALFNDPAGLTFDREGNLFLADSQNHAIRKIATNGAVTTFAGKLGTPGQMNATGTQAQFDSPSGIAIDQQGNLFVSDTGNHTIRKITPAALVTTLAGIPGQSGFANGGLSVAMFNSPLGLKVATNGTIFVCDSGNHLIRAVAPNSSVITFAGNPGVWGSNDGLGEAARFNGPVGLVIDQQGNLMVSDSNNHTIRKITPVGAVSTWAGVPGLDGCRNGDAHTATFCNPGEIVIDAKNNLFVADSFNHVIRRITPDGRVSTVSGAVGDNGSIDGINGQARFFNPYAIAMSPDGSLVIADAYNQLIRVLLPPFDLTIQSSTHSAVTLSWPSILGKQYQVQYQNTLTAAAWVNLGPPLRAVSLTGSQSDNSSSGSSQRIYRVVRMP